MQAKPYSRQVGTRGSLPWGNYFVPYCNNKTHDEKAYLGKEAFGYLVQNGLASCSTGHQAHRNRVDFRSFILMSYSGL